LENYFVLFVFFVVSVAIAVFVPNVNLITNRLLKINRNITTKYEPYECGIPQVHPLSGRYSTSFYVLALVFLLFNIEMVFLFPWAVAFRELGVFGLAEALVFVAILLTGLLYAVAKGVLKWD